MTRAARSAWLFGRVRQGKQALQAPSSSLLQRILPVLEADMAALQVTIATPPMAAAASAAPRERLAAQPLRRLPADWQLPASAVLWPQAPTAVEDDPLHRQLLARSIGELVHAGLRHCVEHGSSWLQHVPAPPLWRRTLAPLCADAAALEHALQSVRSQLQQCLASARHGWLFSRRLQDDACELPLVDYSHGYRRDYTVDRTFIDDDGLRWIIDYKTAVPAAGQSPAVFMQQQADHYREQLHTYRRLLAALHPPSAARCRIALYFTALDELLLLP